jgi:hypothetical protein
MNLIRRFFFPLALLAATQVDGAITTSISYQPSPVDLNDLDHHMLYTWRIDNINLNVANISGATLTISSIRNWDSNTNVLHLHLLDTAINPGVASFQDVDQTQAPVVDLTDDFVSTRYHNSNGWLVASGTGDKLLGNPSFTTTATNYVLNFDAADLVALKNYISTGHDIALGFDPDCHFFNNGITFSIQSTPVPEMSATLPILGLIAFVVLMQLGRVRREGVAIKD